MQLKKLFFCSTLILLFNVTAGFTQQNAVKRVIITWDFFKNDKPIDAKADVLVHGGVGFQYIPIKTKDGKAMKLSAVIKINLDTAKSYVDFTKKNDHMLHYQQGMIDIATIYANKLKDTVNLVSVTPENYHLKAKNLYSLIGDQLLEKQKNYQLETKGGTDTLMQKKWDSYFKTTLGFK